jgi:UDP:flavonoid glycosyltransferase YjiC (YdhE family)
MRITLYTIGGRGDVQPFVALALRLMQVGHDVKLAACRPRPAAACARGADHGTGPRRVK